MLARMAASLQPDLTPAKDQTIDTLKEWLAARRALVKDRTATLNRSKGLTLAHLNARPTSTSSRSPRQSIAMVTRTSGVAMAKHRR